MTDIIYCRDSLCMGDDAMRADYTISLSNDATLGDLMDAVLNGGHGNDWRVPMTSSDTYWIVESNIGHVADVMSDGRKLWKVEYITANADIPLSGLGITSVYCKHRLLSERDSE